MTEIGPAAISEANESDSKYRICAARARSLSESGFQIELSQKVDDHVGCFVQFMMKTMVRRISVGMLAAALSAGVVSAQDKPPAKIELKDFPATTVDQVVVPVPSEIFNVLDKLSSPNWKAELRTDYDQKSSDRAQIALQMGAVIGDGFIAVEAKDRTDVQAIGKLVLEYAGTLSVKDAVIKHYKSIQEAADASDWDRVRTELDKTQFSVRDAMTQLGDDQLAQLVSLGGWIRGTEVLTSIVGKNYSTDGAELLHQPRLVEYFQDQIGGMDGRYKNNKVVKKIGQDLKALRPLIGVDDGRAITVEAVSKIHGITSELVKLIKSKNA